MALKVVMFTGKGGVGKSTCSAATALHFSRAGEKTLIITSDPAPSLSGIFEVEVGDKITEVRENLFALELSSEEILRRWKERFGGEVYEVLSSLVPVKEDIIDYIGRAPGIDEEFMLHYIYELHRERKFDRIIWDTAPAGHTLRLLGMPIIFIQHLEEASRVYLKIYSSMIKIREKLGLKAGERSIFDIIEGWKKLSQDILEFLQREVAVYAVCIPEGLSVEQSLRLRAALEENGIKIQGCVVNNIITSPDCEYHRRKAEMQRKYIEKLEKNFSRIKLLPALEYEVKGLKALDEIEALLFDNSERFFQPIL